MIHCIEYDEALMCPAPVGELESIANATLGVMNKNFHISDVLKVPCFRHLDCHVFLFIFIFYFFFTIKQVYVLFKGALCSLGEEI